MLNKIKLLLGSMDDDKDDVLQLLINVVTDEVKDYCNVDSVDGMESVIIQMVIIKYNLIGHEGVASESYSGVSYTYEHDYPDSILSTLKKHRRLRVL